LPDILNVDWNKIGSKIIEKLSIDPKEKDLIQLIEEAKNYEIPD
jgi:hypothetical protein